MQTDRQWALLKILQNSRHEKSTAELWGMLNNEMQGKNPIDIRNVQRDMAFLYDTVSEIEKRTAGRVNYWIFKSNSNKLTPGLSEDEASRFADETRVLRETLQPASFESKITHHVLGFIGREWIFDAYSHWVEHQPESHLFWIKAAPGFGKSAFAANLVHRKRSSVAACWFCDSKSSELKDPTKAIKSIAFQIALGWEDYRIRLLHKLHLHANASDEYCDDIRKKLEKKNTHDIFLSIIAEPMAGLWRENKLVVVIDALDEATDEQGNNRIAELIGKELNSLPEWIGFVVTSRAEDEIINRLSGFTPFEIDAKDPHNLADLRSWYQEYIRTRKELQELPSIEQQRIEDLIFERSSGMILYLKVVEEGFQEGSLTVTRLEELESGLPGLNRRYYDSFQHRFGVDYETSVKPLLRLLLAADGSLPEDLAREVLGWNSEQFHSCLSRLGCYVVETETGYEFFHQTLSDWLSNYLSGLFHLDIDLGRQMLADVLFDELKNNEDQDVRWREPMITEWLPAWLPQLSQCDDVTIVDALANALGGWAFFSTARQLLERSLARREKFLGLDHPMTAVCLNNLAEYFKVQGDYAGAEKLYRRALAIMEKNFGTENPNAGMIQNNLAVLLVDQGRYAEAESLYWQSLEIAEKVLGPEHPETATSLSNMALFLQEKGDYTRAEPLFRRALAINEKTLNPEHPLTSTIINNLAVLLKIQGDYASAEPLYRRALAIREKTLGTKHPDTATSLDTLGSFLETQGNYAEALPLFSRALAIREKILGPEHPDTATSLDNLADLMETLGEYAGAEPMYRRALAIREKAYGPEHTMTATSLNNLAEFLRVQGDYAEAEPLYRRAFAIYERVMGSKHLKTTTIQSNLSVLLANQGGSAVAKVAGQLNTKDGVKRKKTPINLSGNINKKR